MLRDPALRRGLAIIGITLGLVASVIVVWSVVTGQAEWWALIILIPVLAVMLRLQGLASSGG